MRLLNFAYSFFISLRRNLGYNMELSDWFKGFEKGIARLSSKQRESFFSECGKNCVQSGTLQVYKTLYEDAHGDLDIFFLKANELPGVRCEIAEKGTVYHLYFTECTCDLSRSGYVRTPLLMFQAEHPVCVAFIMEKPDISGNYLRFHFTGKSALQNAN